MTTKKSDDTQSDRPIEIEASELDSLDTSRLASFNNLHIKDYRGGVLDLRFLDETPSLTALVVEIPDDDETSQATTEEWILPTQSSIVQLILVGIQPDSLAIDKFSTWELSNFALNKIDYTVGPFQHLSKLMTMKLQMIRCNFSSLPELNYVENLVVNDCNIDILDLNNISSKYLKNLELRNSGKLCNEHLSQIRQITSLEILILVGLGKNGPKYPALQGIDYLLLDGHPSLRTLNITGIKGAFNIPRLPSLETLGLYRIESEEIDLSPLADSKNLRRLYISTYQRPSVGFLSLNQLDLSPLASCTHLQKIFITDPGVEEIDLTPLLHIESLDELFIYDVPDTKLFADSRFKDKIKSPSIKSLDRNGHVEWR